MRKSALLATVVAAAFAGTGCGAKTYNLVLNPKPNQQFAYNVVMNATAPTGQPVKMEMGMRMTAQKVEADRVTFKTEITKMLMNGMTMPGVTPEALKRATLEQVLDKKGKLISQKGGTPGMETQNPAVGGNLPDKPVRVGDTWTTESQGMKGTSKLVSVSNVGGRQIANIEVTLTSNDKIKTTKPFKMAIDLGTGMTVSGAMDDVQSQGMTMDMSIMQTN